MEFVYRTSEGLYVDASTGKVVATGPGDYTIWYLKKLEEDKVLGKTTVTVHDVPVEPTGIQLNKESAKIYNNGSSDFVTLKATVFPTYPYTVTNNTVIWESSDTSLATVSSSGKVKPVSGDKSGSVTITAYTYNKAFSAKCTVLVEARGTKIIAISPTKQGVEATGQTITVNLTKQLLNNYDSGFTVTYGGEVGSTPYRKIGTTTKGVDSVQLQIYENFGNARTFILRIHGNSTGDYGKSITINQHGSTKAKDLKYYTSGKCYANGTFYGGFAGSLTYICAAGYGKEMLAEIMKASNHESWIHFRENTFAVESTKGYSRNEMLDYENSGTINGKDPGFNGVTVACSVSIYCDANTGGQRTGYIKFPGGKRFTIVQDGV